MSIDRSRQWDATYGARGEYGVSWFQASPERSLNLIRRFAAGSPLSVVDIGGGASRLVDAGLAAGWRMSVLDVSPKALEVSRQRLGAAAGTVDWIVADVTRWRPGRLHDVWHDRAAFHFLTAQKDRRAYVEGLRQGLRPGGLAVIATFAADGPERCSGLPVQRYDPAALARTLGDGFVLVASERELHPTPLGSTQSFQFSVLRRAGG